MFKKIAFFVFSLGLSASFAYAGDWHTCRDSCEDNFEMCLLIKGNTPRKCLPSFQACRAECDARYPR